MHCDAARVPASDFDFAGVEARPDLDPDALDTIDDRSSAPHGSRRSVEGRLHPVARQLVELAAVPLDLFARQLIVLGQQASPLAIPELCRALGGSDDIREQDRGENAIRIRRWPDTGDEVLDLDEEGVGVRTEEDVIAAWEFDILRVRNDASHVPTSADLDRPIAGAVDD